MIYSLIVSTSCCQTLLFLEYFLIYIFKRKTIDHANICFEIYRSLNCIFFSLNSGLKLIKNFSFYYPYLSENLFITQTDFNYFDIRILFLNYIIFDILYMCRLIQIRMDLFIHHIICLFGFFLIWDKPFLLEYVLLLELISSLNFVKYIFNSKYNELIVYYWKGITILFIRFPFHIQYLRNYLYFKETIFKIYFPIIYFSLVILDLYWLKKLNSRIC